MLILSTMLLSSLRTSLSRQDVAFNGIWESRTETDGITRVYDSGPLSVPIPLPLAGKRALMSGKIKLRLMH